MEEARLKAAQLAAGRIEGVEMGRSDRDELQAVRSLAGDVPVVAAMQEWRQARELTNGNIIPAAEAWAARSGSIDIPRRESGSRSPTRRSGSRFSIFNCPRRRT